MSGPRKCTLVLGGARSGKSAYAESLADGWKGPRVFIATAEPGDEEMAARIKAHRARRGKDWTTHATILDLPGAIRDEAAEDTLILVDCLTMWLTNVLLAEQDADMALEQLMDELASAHGTLVIVSNEVGGGIVPGNALARRFRDVTGEANQRVAREADEVVLVAAGLPMLLKPSTP